MSSDTLERDETGPAMDMVESAHGFVRGLRDSASVGRVYGEPIEIGRTTIVPVARVAYGFGGGFGSGGEETDEAGHGGGGGGGMRAAPVGVVEVTDEGTRFVRFASWRRLVLAAGIGVVLGVLFGRR